VNGWRFFLGEGAAQPSTPAMSPPLVMSNRVTWMFAPTIDAPVQFAPSVPSITITTPN